MTQDIRGSETRIWSTTGAKLTDVSAGRGLQNTRERRRTT